MHQTPPEQEAAPRARSRRWPWILVVATTVLAVAGAAVYLATRSASYEATTDVLVAPLASEYPNFQAMPLIRESSDGSRPVQTGAGLLSGPDVARLTAKNMGTGWDAETVEEDVVVVPRGESNIVAITGSTDSASSAAQLANAYANAGLTLRRRALQPYITREIAVLTGEPDSAEALKQLRAAQDEGDPTLSIASHAQVPNSSADPSAKVVLLAALIVGLLVGAGAVIVTNVARPPRQNAP